MSVCSENISENGVVEGCDQVEITAMDFADETEEYIHDSPMRNDSEHQSFSMMPPLDAFHEITSENDSPKDDRNVPEDHGCTWDYIECEYPAEFYPRSESKENYQEGREVETGTESVVSEIYQDDVTNAISMQNSPSKSLEADNDHMEKEYNKYPQDYRRQTKSRIIANPVLGVVLSETKKSRRGEKRRLKRPAQEASKCFVMDVDELFKDQLNNPIHFLNQPSSPSSVRNTLKNLQNPLDDRFSRTIYINKPKLRIQRRSDFYNNRLADIMEVTGLDPNLTHPQCVPRYMNGTEVEFPYEADFRRSNHSLYSEGEMRSCIFCAEGKQNGDGNRYPNLAGCRYLTNRQGQRDSSSTISSRKCTLSKASLFVEIGESCAKLSNLSFPSSTSFLDHPGECDKSDDSTGQLRNLSRREYIGNPMRIISKALLAGPSGSCDSNCITQASKDEERTSRRQGEKRKRRLQRTEFPKPTEGKDRDWRENRRDKNESATIIAKFSIDDQSVRSDTNSMEGYWDRKVVSRGHRQNRLKTKNKGLNCRKSLEEMKMRSNKFASLRKRTKNCMTDKTSQTKYDVHVNTSTNDERSGKVEQSFWAGLHGIKVLSQMQEICKNFLQSTVTNINNIFKGSAKTKRAYSRSVQIPTKFVGSSRCSSRQTCEYSCKKNSKAKISAIDKQTSFSNISDNSSKEFQQKPIETNERYFEDKCKNLREDIVESFEEERHLSGTHFCQNPCCSLFKRSNSKNSEHEKCCDSFRKNCPRGRRHSKPLDMIEQSNNDGNKCCRNYRSFHLDFMDENCRTRGGADAGNILKKDKTNSGKSNNNQVDAEKESPGETKHDLVDSEEEGITNDGAQFNFQATRRSLDEEIDTEMNNLVASLVTKATQPIPILFDERTSENPETISERTAEVVDTDTNGKPTKEKVQSQVNGNHKAAKKKVKVSRTVQAKTNVETNEGIAKSRQSKQSLNSSKGDLTSLKIRSNFQSASIAKGRTSKLKKKVTQKRKDSRNSSVEKGTHCRIIGKLRIICVDQEGKEVAAEMSKLCFCEERCSSRVGSPTEHSPLTSVSWKKDISIQNPESSMYIPGVDFFPLMNCKQEREEENSQKIKVNRSSRKRWPKLSYVSSETTLDAGSTTLAESKSSITVDVLSSDLFPNGEISKLVRTISTMQISYNSSKFWDCPFEELEESIVANPSANTLREANEKFPKDKDVDNLTNDSNTISTLRTIKNIDEECPENTEDTRENVLLSEKSATDSVDMHANSRDTDNAALLDSTVIKNVEDSTTKPPTAEETEKMSNTEKQTSVFHPPLSNDDSKKSEIQDLTSVVARTLGTVMAQILTEHNVKDEKGKILMNIRIETTTDYKKIRTSGTREESSSATFTSM